MSLSGVSENVVFSWCSVTQRDRRQLTCWLDQEREEGVHAGACRDEVRSEMVIVFDGRQTAIKEP